MAETTVRHVERRASSKPAPPVLEGLPVFLTQREFDDLGEYSCSLPTGTTIGKRWKRDKHAYWKRATYGEPSGHRWWMGEYVHHPDPTKVGIHWSPVIILSEP